MKPLSFFLAGTVQGSRMGQATVDQAYRTAIRAVVLRHFPDAVVHCPVSKLHEEFHGRKDELAAAFSELQTLSTFTRADYPSSVTEVAASFARLVDFASECDVFIGYLPGNEASMGTAMEIWSAHTKGRVVILISEMKQHLALIATATLVVNSIEALDGVLATGWLGRILSSQGPLS